MAARPNARRTLVYGQRLAENHVTRLSEMIEMCDRVVGENKLLTPDEIDAYKECARTGRKQLALFTKLAELGVPDVDTSTSRRSRGRPSKAELASLNALRKGGASKKVSVKKAAAAAPKAAVPTTPVKRRGRPPKAVAAPVAPAPVVAPKRRGRPPKSATSAVAADPTAAPRKPGRPKGSGNKAKVLNGSNTATAVTAAADAAESV